MRTFFGLLAMTTAFGLFASESEVDVPVEAQNQLGLQSLAISQLAVAPRYWFAPKPVMPQAPNKGGSVDFMSLFTTNSAWPTAASHIQVFKLYGEWLLAGNATDAQIAQVVANLKSRGIALAVEGGPLTPTSQCGNGIEGFAGSQWPGIMNRIKKAGGTIDYIDMDEPYYFGHTYAGAGACQWTSQQIAQQVASFINTVHDQFPNAIVGDAEPTDVGSAAEFQTWLSAFQSATGHSLPHLHLDVQWSNANWPQLTKSIETMARSVGVPFGIIYNGDGLQSDEDWFWAAAHYVKTYELNNGGNPDQIIFQSWDPMPDHVLPETNVYTFTNFIDGYFTNKTTFGYPLNLAENKSVQASNQISGNEVAKAVDGDPSTQWSSGGFPPEWITIDLGALYNVQRVLMLVTQSPAGQTTHTLYGSTVGGSSWQALKTFQGNTSDGQDLIYQPTQPAACTRFLEILTTTSPSWVGWREIRVTGTPASVEACLPNLALQKNAQASATLSGNGTSLAVDGDVSTWWGAGAFPPQWISVDLGASHSIWAIRLNVSQYPAGQTSHTIYGKGPNVADTWNPIKTFSGYTTDGQVLDYVLPQPINGIEYVKVQTTQSPSWVGWREISIYGN